MTDLTQEGETSRLSKELQSPLGELPSFICQARPHLRQRGRPHHPALPSPWWSLIAGMIHRRYELWTRKDLTGVDMKMSRTGPTLLCSAFKKHTIYVLR
ncbi:hypothetical protein Tco_1119236 [Tanacetum coccineum]